MAAGGMLLNLLLNIILIPHYKAMGSALSSLITQGLTALLQVYFAQHIFKFKTNYRYLGSLLIFAILSTLTTLFCKVYVQDLIVSFIVCIAAFACYALFLRIVSFKSLRKELATV